MKKKSKKTSRKGTKHQEPHVKYSLGAPHCADVELLGKFLSLEALDKKGVRTTRAAIGRSVSVPAQPNIYDCGIYLLHFAATFMSNPSLYSDFMRTSTIPLGADLSSFWKESQIPSLREDIKRDILELSAPWSSWMVTRTTNADKGPASSESDVEILEKPLRSLRKRKRTAVEYDTLYESSRNGKRART
ncbi:hypothetical protein ARMSODRAFT_1028473 [Armillaria solidipes]|uniref:Ubiquitin-like protease family profile domain-containing protein n=1 Tax=Armillaria solidipes TaxID=1076256 RepID=A0A2H3ATC9_9AGAR|nr:hypothetical protein ARMSODRAFT_1028473 [Armillaria solidipes]